MQRDDDMASPVVVYVAVWSLRETVVPPFVRDARLADWTAVPVVVPERAVTRRVVVGVAARAVVDLFVALRAADVVPARAVVDVFVRAATRRVVVAFAVVALRCEPAADDVAARAVALDVGARRGTTLRVVVPFDLVRVKTLICAFDCDGLTPGFKLVRMVLFIYGYKLLYVFALT